MLRRGGIGEADLPGASLRVEIPSTADIDNHRLTRRICLHWTHALVAHRGPFIIARSDTMTSDRALVRPQIGLFLPQWDGQLFGPPEPPAPRWSELQSMALVAEDVGLDSLWLVDDLLFEGTRPGDSGKAGRCLPPWRR